ncbi:MAG: hypothetical protein HOO93_00110 [Methyloglobulus sp.]|nr:hypothetical protein [Methyloglobulus sp.]
MKKIAYLIQLLAVTLLFSSAAVAHDRDWGRHGHGWGYHGWGHHHHGHHHGWGGYPRQRVNNYYPVPQANYYYQQPPAYYQPRPQYYPSRPHYNDGGGRYCENRFR